MVLSMVKTVFGVVIVICVEEFTVTVGDANSVPSEPTKVTVAPLWKFVPIVILVFATRLL